MNRSQLINNFIVQSYLSLREGERFVQQEKCSKSHFEAFWDNINNAFSMGLRGYRPPNYTVESFYRGTLDVKEFRLQVRETLIDKNMDKLDANLDPLLTISWEVYSSVQHRRQLCTKIPRLCGRQLWGIFNKLVFDSTGTATIDDITDVILNLYKVNGKEELHTNIHEWFCSAEKVDFWSFYSSLVENHSYLIAPSALQSVYDIVYFEILKEGKMRKKGHKVANWKERWFILSSSQLFYYESQENRSLKGTVVVNKNSKVEKLNSTKDHPYLFRLTDGKTGVRYDLSANDPQTMNEWIEKIQVVIAAHSEEGYTILQKLRQAQMRVFPDSVQNKSLPVYKQNSTTEYNEGIYRVVQPSKQNDSKITSQKVSLGELPPILKSNRPTSPVQIHEQPTNTILTPPPLTPSPTPTYEAVKSVAGPKIRPYKSDSKILLQPSSPSPTNSSNSDHFYVNVRNSNSIEPNYDLSSGDSMSPSPPPVTITQQAPRLNHRDTFMEIQHVNMNGQNYALVEKGKVKDDFSSPTPPNSPDYVSEPTYVNVNRGIVGGVVSNDLDYNRRDMSSPPPLQNVLPRQAPVPKKRTLKPKSDIPPQQNVPNPIEKQSASDMLDYPELEFMETPKNVTTKLQEKTVDYADVLLLEDANIKDVEKAIKLKANKQPPNPPSKYTPKSQPVPPVAPPRQASLSSIEMDGDLPPLPPPRQSMSTDEMPPVPPPRY